MNNSYGNSVFRSFEFPVFEAGNRPDNDTDTDPRGRHGRHKMWTAETPTLRHIISSGHELHQRDLPPCLADELLVREAYWETYDILVADHGDRMEHVRAERKIPPVEEVRPDSWPRPTNNDNRVVDLTESTHYLTNGNGVHPMPTHRKYGVLADRHTFGSAPKVDHSWLVATASAPRTEDNRCLIKDYSPPRAPPPFLGFGRGSGSCVSPASPCAHEQCAGD